MKAVLVFDGGPTEGRTVPLKGGKALIGRGNDCDLQVLDESLSRVHCLIEQKGDEYFITDLNSRNGTYLDGKRVKKTEKLSPGSAIALGDLKLRFRQIEMAAGTGSSLGSLLDGAGKTTERIHKRLDPTKTPLVAATREELLGAESGRLQRDLATIYKIGNLISSENDVTVLCDVIVDSILDVVTVDRGFLLLGDTVDTAHPMVVRGAEAGDDTNLKLSRTILAETLDKGLAVLSSDAVHDERFKGGDSIVQNRITSVMCVPLEAEGVILGAIYVDTRGESNAFDEADLELLGAVGRQAGVAIERAKLMEDLENLFYDSVSTLVATIEASDQYTRGHSERVTRYAVGIAGVIDLGGDDIAVIRLAGLLHDIGKISIPTAVLHKTEKLTDEEWQLIKEHPGVGANIISNIRRMKESVVSAVRHHHERWDGDGYPDGLKGEDIPLISRILTVADSFDAMTSRRPYRDFVRTPEEAVEELRDKTGKQFDGDVVEAFVESRSGDGTTTA
jgi:putative nucleotidyltransferase with HDIG domain